MLPFFLARSREWWAVADALRARNASAADPVLGVWREAAWCHLLHDAGKYPAAAARLRVVFRSVTGMPPNPTPLPTSAAEVLSAAAEVFARLRAAVSARHPDVFARAAA